MVSLGRVGLEGLSLLQVSDRRGESSESVGSATAASLPVRQIWLVGTSEL